MEEDALDVDVNILQTLGTRSLLPRRVAGFQIAYSALHISEREGI